MPGFITKNIGKKDVVFYNITLKLQGKIWNLQKRFSEFNTLHQELKNWVPNHPDFPKKTLFRKKEEQFVINRKCKLELYLRTLMEKDNILGVDAFVKFLKIDENANFLALNQIKLLGRIDQDKLGYRDVVHLPEEKVYFAVSADTRVASRLDSYINNKKFLWTKNKTEEDKKAVGTISCFALIKNSPLVHENYEIMW